MKASNVGASQLLIWEFIPGKIIFPHVGAESDNEDYGILRAKVPGGWLIATIEGGPEEGAEAEHYKPRGLCFYPDACHAWNLTSSE
jgi:hypothetical protein